MAMASRPTGPLDSAALDREFVGPRLPFRPHTAVPRWPSLAPLRAPSRRIVIASDRSPLCVAIRLTVAPEDRAGEAAGSNRWLRVRSEARARRRSRRPTRRSWFRPHRGSPRRSASTSLTKARGGSSPARLAHDPELACPPRRVFFTTPSSFSLRSPMASPSPRNGDLCTVRASYSSKRLVASRSRSYRLVSGNGGNQDSRRTIQLS